jgi:hypothetical protein
LPLSDSLGLRKTQRRRANYIDESSSEEENTGTGRLSCSSSDILGLQRRRAKYSDQSSNEGEDSGADKFYYYYCFRS